MTEISQWAWILYTCTWIDRSTKYVVYQEPQQHKPNSTDGL